MSLISVNQAIANLDQIQIAPHVAAAMSLAVGARPKETPPVETFQVFQVLCGHIEPELLALGMAECLQHCKWFPTPNEVLDACDFIQQIIAERGIQHRLNGYAARNMAEAKTLTLQEFKRRLLPPTQGYIERERAARKPVPKRSRADEIAFYERMLTTYETHLANAKEDDKRDYFRRMIEHDKARIAELRSRQEA